MRRHLIFTFPLLFLPVLTLSQTGIPSFASLTQSQFAAINNGNGNVVFALPIMSSPGRGLNLNLNATYNSLMWVKSVAGGAPAWSPLGPWTLQTPVGATYDLVTTTSGSCGHLGSGYTETTLINGYTYVVRVSPPTPEPILVMPWTTAAIMQI